MMSQFKENRPDVLHGILLIVLFSFSAFYIADFEFVRKLSLSPLIVGIILGMLYANSLRNKLPQTWVPGIQFCTKQVLRLGVVLYGFRLTFQQGAEIGLPAIAADLGIVFGPHFYFIISFIIQWFHFYIELFCVRSFYNIYKPIPLCHIKP